jgi:transcriptional regulator with PAS, ATPase and Fis domain
MPTVDWTDEAPMAITVTDEKGTILSMNDRAAEVFAADGGRALVGTDVMQCHSEASRKIIENILGTGTPHIYTIEKKGKRKMIVQMPWHRDGKSAGLVELSFELPSEVPHFVRG